MDSQYLFLLGVLRYKLRLALIFALYINKRTHFMMSKSYLICLGSKKVKLPHILLIKRVLQIPIEQTDFYWIKNKVKFGSRMANVSLESKNFSEFKKVIIVKEAKKK